MDWLKLNKVTIFKGFDENGNRYLSQFIKDYKKIFNPDLINIGCDRCLEDYYLKLTKHLTTMAKPKSDSGYVLKEKYNGIPLGFGSQIQVNNQNITKEFAEKLLKDHPKGADLFEVIPEDNSNDLDRLTRKQLNAKAVQLGLDPKDYKNKEEVIQAITDTLITDASEEE